MKESNKTFNFQNVCTDKVTSIIKKLNIKKSTKSDEIPTKVIKEFKTFFDEIFSKNFNSCLETGSFPEHLKYAGVVPIYKKHDKKDKSNLLVFYPTFQKYMKDAWKSNLTNISVIYYQNVTVVSVKVIGLRIVF